MNTCDFFVDGKCNNSEARKTCSDPCKYTYIELELVKELSSGYRIWKRKNKAGGFTYLNERCGLIAEIWDECIGSEEELIAIAKDCYGLILMGSTADDDFEETLLENEEEK